jgi:hypothetical protein
VPSVKNSCPAGYYCPEGTTTPIACSGRKTSNENSKSAADCYDPPTDSTVNTITNIFGAIADLFRW